MKKGDMQSAGSSKSHMPVPTTLLTYIPTFVPASILLPNHSTSFRKRPTELTQADIALGC